MEKAMHDPEFNRKHSLCYVAMIIYTVVVIMHKPKLERAICISKATAFRGPAS